jgi:hypothetical protein
MSSILYVINTKTQEQIDSVKFLNSLNLSEEGKSEMRMNVMQAINEYKPLFLCGFCKNPVSLSEDSHTRKKRSIIQGNLFQTSFPFLWM